MIGFHANNDIWIEHFMERIQKTGTPAHVAMSRLKLILFLDRTACHGFGHRPRRGVK